MATRTDWKLRERFLIVAGLPLLFMVLSGLAAWWLAGSLVSEARHVAQTDLTLALEVKELQRLVGKVQERYTDVSATRAQDGLGAGFAEADEAARLFVKGAGRVREILDREADTELIGKLSEVEKRFVAFRTAGRKMAEAYVAGGPPEGNRLMPEFDMAAEALSGKLEPFVDESATRATGRSAEVADHLVRMQLHLIVMLVLAVVCAGAMAGWMASRVMASIRRLVASLGQLEEGNLAARNGLTGKRDELALIGQSVDHLGDRLQRVLGVVGFHAASVTASAGELVKIRDQLKTDAEDTRVVVVDVSRENERLAQEVTGVKEAVAGVVGNVESIASSMEQVSLDVVSIAAGAEQASVNISTMASAAEEITANLDGVKKSLEQVDKAVHGVAGSVREVTNALQQVRRRCQAASSDSEQMHEYAQNGLTMMEQLSTLASEIGEVVEVINNIADQTNMLALNASIEAAGAGDAGKGFSVVANEVKELARQTGEATQMIASKIKEIQQQVHLVSGANMEIVQGVSRVNQANMEITHAVDTQSTSIRTIHLAINQVAEAAGEVTRNMSELDMAARDVARAAAEAAVGTAEVARSASHVSHEAQHVADGSVTARAQAMSVLSAATTSEEVSSLVSRRMEDATRTVRRMRGSSYQFHELATVMQDTTNALYASFFSFDTGKPLFNVREVKEHHLAMQGAIAKLSQGRITALPEEFRDAENCPFSRFLQARRGDTQPLPFIREAAKLHEAAHDACVELANRMVRGLKQDDVRRAMTAFLEAQKAFFAILPHLYMKGVDVDQEFFPWDDRLLTRIEFVDRDHRKLVEMVNGFHRALMEGASQEAMSALLAGFAEYTVAHFGREEAMFREHNYPEFTAHKAIHDKLVAEVLRLKKRFDEGSFSVGVELLTLARAWLVDHIMGTDMAFSPYMRERGVR
ncbi:MAG: bacteriohemerythrin [Magnetococcales bacterium]|nr:bacteriohemerythrin [Magnetococcales bacterium]